MSKLSEMPVITVEQILNFRVAALKRESDLSEHLHRVLLWITNWEAEFSFDPEWIIERAEMESSLNEDK